MPYTSLSTGGGSHRSFAFIIACLVGAINVGTAAPALAAAKAPLTSAPAAGYTVTPAELDELTRAFADRYVGLLSSTCDALKKDNADPVQRREAQELMLDAAANVYDIASNADAYTRMLDLVVVTTLLSQVWVDDDRAGDVFGERGEVLVRALHHGRVEAWALAARVLRPDQLDVLDYTIWNWRRQNPDMVRASFVRFSNFALDRGRSANAEVLAASGFFKNIGQTGQAVDEARLLTERMFYLLKREPTLLRWQADAAKDGLLATPDVTTALADVHRLADQVERLPQNVAAERRAVLAAVDERMSGADATLARVQAAVADAKALNASIGQTAASLNGTLVTADGLFTRFSAWDRWSTGLPQHRAFDVREYTAGVKDLAAALQTVNASLKSSSDLLASPEWGRRMQEVDALADGRMRVAAEESRGLMDAMLVRACLAMLAFFAMLTAYRAISVRLARRAKGGGGDERPRGGGGGDGNGHAAPPSPAAAGEPDGGRRDLAVRLLMGAVATLSAVCLSGGCIPSRPTQRIDEHAGDGAVPARAATATIPPSDARPDDLPPYSPLTTLTGKVRSIGASTTTHLAARAAADFRQIYPGVSVEVIATTTDAGPRALIDGKADIVPMSRPLLPSEIAAFRAKYGYPPTEIKVAADALAIYVEKRNPVRGLTLAQLDAIFSRTRLRGSPPIETWGQAGLTGDWANRPIPIYGYGPGDGVHQVFRQEVLAGGEYRLSLQVVPAGSLIVQDVAADPAAIGCASVFFASKRTRTVPLAGDDGVFYAPTEENVRSLRYPLTRFVTVCVNKPPGRPLPAATAEFVRFLLSSEGQQIATAGGNIRLGAATAAVGRHAID